MLATETDRTPREALRVLAYRVLAMPFMSVEGDLAELSTIADRDERDDTFTHLCAAIVERAAARVEGLLDDLTKDGGAA